MPVGISELPASSAASLGCVRKRNPRDLTTLRPSGGPPVDLPVPVYRLESVLSCLLMDHVHGFQLYFIGEYRELHHIFPGLFLNTCLCQPLEMQRQMKLTFCFLKAQRRGFRCANKSNILSVLIVNEMLFAGGWKKVGSLPHP